MRIGWSGSTIPASARPFIYPLSQLRDTVRKHVRSGSSGQAQILKLVESSNSSIQPNTNAESSQPYRDVAEQFRQDLKKLTSANASANDLLALCDQLRDTHLFPLGIYLEDREQLPAMVRPVNKTLLAARQERHSAAAAKREAKAKGMAEEAERKRLLTEKAKLSPVDMFRTATEEYSAWDEQGIPTKDAQGEEIAKSKRKKLVKEWQRQQKLHEEWSKK
jgi:cysteinyl-tRNA synthetase